MKEERGQEEPLLGPAEAGQQNPYFYSGPRPVRDVGWLIAYVSLALLTTGAGIWLFITGEKDFLHYINPDYLSDPGHCPIGPEHGRKLLGEGAGGNMAAAAKHPVGVGVVMVSSGLLLGGLFLAGIKKNAHLMTRAALALQVCIPLALGVSLLVAGQSFGALTMFLMAGALVWVFAMWRDQIQVVGRLLSISGHALVDNPGLVGLGLLTPILWSIILIPGVVFAYGAVTHGEVVPNSARVGKPVPDESGALQCLDADGNRVLCCTWSVAPEGGSYLGLLGLMLTWTSFLLSQLKLFVTSGVVAQWYFTPEGAAAAGASRSAAPAHGKRQGRGRVMTSLGHALGPQFGSICAAAALLTVISYLRQMLEASRRNRANENALVALVASLLTFLLEIVLYFAEFLTRFTTVRAAMSGERFGDAAHNAVDLLKRNALDAFGVWWFPQFILTNCAVMLSVGLGVLLWAGSKVLLRLSDPHDYSPTAIGLLGGVVALLVMAFFSGLIQDTLDAVFFCFAIDRDAGRMTRPDVHAVLKDVPGVQGQVVEQPGGEVAYGAREEHRPGV